MIAIPTTRMSFESPLEEDFSCESILVNLSRHISGGLQSQHLQALCKMWWQHIEVEKESHITRGTVEAG